MSLSAVFGLERILRRIRQLLQLGVDPLARPAATGVGGVGVALVLRQAPLAVGVGVEPPASPRHRDHRPAALIGSISHPPGSHEMVNASMISCLRAAPTS